MKKTLLLLSLVLVIAVSIISGTLAMYTTTIDNLASGSVVAKEFILLENGEDSFLENVKIAPTETVTWEFSVKNHDGALVSETGMDLAFTINVIAAEGKSAIAPLTVTITNENGDTVGSATGTGTIVFADEFAADVADAHTYTATINWPSNDAVDINYAGGNFGTAVKVSVTGTQN